MKKFSVNGLAFLIAPNCAAVAMSTRVFRLWLTTGEYSDYPILVDDNCGDYVYAFGVDVLTNKIRFLV